MITQIVTCDVCGKQKGDVNHWWMYLVDNGIEIRPWNSSLIHWNHACGQECVLKAANKLMQEQMSEATQGKPNE